MKLESLNLLAALPEIVLLVAACVVLLIDAIVPQAKRISTAGLTLLAMIPSAAIIIAQFGQPTQYAFSNMYVADSLAHLLKLCSFIALAVTLIYAGQYVRDRGMERGEFYALALFSLLGQMVMISANHLLIVYLGLELMSLSLYALAALRRDAPASSEAAMKYFVLGALASPRASPKGRSTASCSRSAWCLSSLGWRSNSGPCRSTCGCPTSTRVRPPPPRC